MLPLLLAALLSPASADPCGYTPVPIVDQIPELPVDWQGRTQAVWSLLARDLDTAGAQAEARALARALREAADRGQLERDEAEGLIAEMGYAWLLAGKLEAAWADLAEELQGAQSALERQDYDRALTAADEVLASAGELAQDWRISEAQRQQVAGAVDRLKQRVRDWGGS